METNQILSECTVIYGTTVKLPDTQLDRKAYMDVAKRLEGIGGKWNRKLSGFSFDFDPTELLAEISTGAVRNLKKEFQFFETPEDLAKRLVELADIRSGQTVLEPSAGRGAIIKEIANKVSYIECFELNPQNHQSLECLSMNLFLNEALINLQIVGRDFLKARESLKYPRIVANPPFSKNQDIDHIRKMYAVLADNGILVSIASTHWQLSNNRKETEFRSWLDEVGTEVIPIPAGTFAESGTNIPTVIIKIRK